MGPISTECYGIKCDAPGCGWSDMSVPRRDYPNWRNRACPQCAANVLTDADWKALRRAERATAFVNVLLFWMKPPSDGDAARRTDLIFNGTGRVTIQPGSEPTDGALEALISGTAPEELKTPPTKGRGS